MIRVEPWADPALRLHEIEQQLLTLNLENKRQWYERQPDAPPTPPDWLGFTGMPPTSSTTTSSTSTTTSTSSSSTTTVAGTCPDCMSVAVGAATYVDGGAEAWAAVDVAMGGGGAFGLVPCTYSGAKVVGSGWAVGTPTIYASAACSSGDPTDDWFCQITWPNSPEGSACIEQATYKKAAPNSGPGGTYTFDSSPPGCHRLTYPGSVTITACGSTSTTTTTTSTTTTTVACPGGTGSWIWNCSGGWLFTTGDGTCTQPASPPAEYTPCVDGTIATYSCSTCTWSIT